ncbi:HAD-IC family P-type ATPase [Bifidobacterium magnum]|uniref:Cation-transporting ATPase n=1 Tax=Bifidobacterium magnum TaxID=1692 RepID=A0A087BC59_9BIFI|nr:HAD-IC family P-type ATPase [Bifidobacterium magnum]KFI68609.1 Cation-transporting ATPase [Bifidobacterium magnum]
MNAAVTLPDVSESGLTAEQVQERVHQGQTNEVNDKPSRSLASIIRSNVFTLFNGIIITAMIFVLLAGSWKDAVFGFVIIINTGIGIATELKAKHALDKLSILVASDYVVRRGGKNVDVPGERIVLGDTLWLGSGEQVPADGVIVQTWGLELDESMITGESRTVRKKAGDTVFSGSTVTAGVALVTVSAVGDHSYAATLTAQAKVYKKTVSDLNHGINTILKFMTVLVVPLCILLICTQMGTVGGWSEAIATGSWRHAVVSSVAGVVGMIPEGLVLLTSLNFALAAIRLARHNTLVQNLDSVETLARVDALNLDKTGTITDGGIQLDRVAPVEGARASDSDIRQALFDLANEQQPNATGRAVLEALGADHVSVGDVRTRVPFSSSRKWSAVAYDDSRWYLGAPEVLLAALDGDYHDVAAQVEQYAAQGNRVLLMVCDAHAAPQDFATNPGLDAQALPMAVVLCSERIRSDAESTLAWFREQGVRCRVISGDNPATVRAIASKVRLTGDREPRAMDARELPSDINQLAQVLEDVDVLGRVLPEQKKAIVQALHAKHHVVAMTGDGVNDALALKEADLGIAMGNAAPATKAVAEVVLVDSKFSHLPTVVARGRQVMANMERVASLFLVKTVYSALISFGVVLTAIPYPYLPRHITYIGALTIGAPAFILALAPNTRRYIPGFLTRVFQFALPCGAGIALAVLMTAWFIPAQMHWHVDSSAADLTQLRSICAMMLFILSIVVLARVARPLNSWRGLLVLAFAAVGVTGACIPFVAHFFALVIPTGSLMWTALIALGYGVVIFTLCLLVVPRLFPYGMRLVSRWRSVKKR